MLPQFFDMIGLRAQGTTFEMLFWALVLCVGLLLHVSALGLAYAQAQSQWKEAPTSHGLVALAVQEWTPGSSLLLVDFPGADRGDDDKDVLDPAWAHLRFDQRVRFEPPDLQPSVDSVSEVAALEEVTAASVET